MPEEKLDLKIPNRAYGREEHRSWRPMYKQAAVEPVRNPMSPHTTGELPHPDDDQARPSSQVT